MPKTLINGQSYSFVDCSFTLAGVEVDPAFTGVPIKSISWNISQQKTPNYENSKYATSYSYSKMTYGGSVTFTLDTAELLRNAIFMPGVRERSIVAMPATDLILRFSVAGKVNTTIIKNMAFMTENSSGSEGDDQFTVTCDFIASYVDFGLIGANNTGTEVLGTFTAGVLDSINFGDNQG